MLWYDRICLFLANLVLVAVDEGHCVKDWHMLRPHYQLIGSLHALLSGVKFMVLSATLTASTVTYITKTANLWDPIHIQQSIAWPNITITTHEIRSGFDQLNFMIPNSAFLAHQILLGMVFINNINDGMALVTHLRNCLPNRLLLVEMNRFDFSTGNFDALTRKKYLDDFRNRDRRFLWEAVQWGWVSTSDESKLSCSGGSHQFSTSQFYTNESGASIVCSIWFSINWTFTRI